MVEYRNHSSTGLPISCKCEKGYLNTGGFSKFTCNGYPEHSNAVSDVKCRKCNNQRLGIHLCTGARHIYLDVFCYTFTSINLFNV